MHEPGKPTLFAGSSDQNTGMPVSLRMAQDSQAIVIDSFPYLLRFKASLAGKENRFQQKEKAETILMYDGED
jgi:hypothetical protein